MTPVDIMLYAAAFAAAGLAALVVLIALCAIAVSCWIAYVLWS